MRFSDIRAGSPRGIAYEKAREMPGFVVRFQAEDGMCTVRYVRGTAADEVMSVVMTPAQPGYWYEKAVTDVTKISEDRTIGFRVQEEDDWKDI